MIALVLFAILHSAGGARAADLAPVVYAEATATQHDPVLLVAIIEAESNFRAALVSPDGRDVGLMGVRLTGAGKGYTVEALKDPATNVHVGAAYFAARARVCRRTIGALSDYNAGPANRCRPNDYGRAVFSRYRRLRELLKNERTVQS